MAPPTTNTAWTVPATASKFSDLTQQTTPIPVPGPHQVLVRLTGASLNFRDLLIATRSPQYPGTHKPNLTPCADGAGVIHAPGLSSIWSSKAGTKVLLHPNNWISDDVRNLNFTSILGGTGTDGTLQQWLVVDDDCVVEASGHLSAVESASLVTAGTTAWSAIVGGLDGRLDGTEGEWEGGWKARRLEGKSILTMGTGGVSCFAIQIASALNATIIATSSSSTKLTLAKSLGAKHTINYTTTPNWDQEVLRLTDGKGVDHVIETGGAGTLMKSLAATRPGGLVSLLGILTPNEAIDAAFVPSVLFGGKIVKGCMAFNRDAFASFAQFVSAHGIKPVIAQEFDFEDAVAAFEALQNQSAVGKIGIRISDE